MLSWRLLLKYSRSNVGVLKVPYHRALSYGADRRWGRSTRGGKRSLWGVEVEVGVGVGQVSVSVTVWNSSLTGQGRLQGVAHVNPTDKPLA